MRWRRPRVDVDVDLEPGERVLATASGSGGDVVATTHRLLLPSSAAGDGAELSVPWTSVETASWDGDEQVLMVAEVADAAGRRTRHRVPLDQPGPLVDVVREQVTASVVISRHVAVEGRRGVRVTGRRTPHDQIVWSATLDPGIDLAEPTTKQRVDTAVATIRNEVE